MELQSSAVVPLSQILVQHIVHPTSLQKQHWPFVSFFLSFVLILKDNWTDSALKMWYLQCDTCENPFVSFLISCNPWISLFTSGSERVFPAVEKMELYILYPYFKLYFSDSLKCVSQICICLSGSGACVARMVLVGEAAPYITSQPCALGPEIKTRAKWKESVTDFDRWSRKP